MVTVVIESGYHWTYYEWFILGMYQLQEKGEIKLRFKLPLFSKLLTVFSNERLAGGLIISEENGLSAASTI